MKLRAWMDILVSIIMLVISGYLLADSSVMSLDLLSNPNLNVAIELIRLFWGVVGVLYFLYYLYHGFCAIRPQTSTVAATPEKSSVKTHKKPQRKTAQKTSKTK